MEDSRPKQTFHLRDIPTKSLTLYPSRAHVTREIRNVTLQSGLNELEIYGLGPNVDESSISIDGSGSLATITDMTVDLVANRDDYYDIYPEDDDDLSEDDLKEPDFDESSDPKVQELSEKIETAQREYVAATDLYSNTQSQLSNLDLFLDSLHSKETSLSAEELAENLKAYQTERSRLHCLACDTLEKSTKLQRQKAKLVWKKHQAQKNERLQNKRQQLAERRAMEKKQRQKAEKRREAEQLTQERQKYWPNSVYKVVVRVELITATPGSSRKNSLDSITLAKTSPEDLDKLKFNQESQSSVNLTLKYITESAYWTPRYDLSISSLQKTAAIVYRAELTNRTSETFKDAKIILSTSQTSFSGLDDKAPTMNGWTVALQKSYGAPNVDALSGLPPSMNKSVNMKPKSKKALNSNLGYKSEISRAALHQSHGGVVPPPPPAASMPLMSLQQRQHQAYSSLLPDAHVAQAPQAPGSSNLDRRVSSLTRLSRSLVGGSRGRNDGITAAAAIRESDEVAAPIRCETPSESSDDEQEDGVIDFKESSWEDSGLTATYELPGTRTVVPSSTARRHKIATLNASNVHLSHICVPKLRASAFLRAKVKNPSSSVTLLKGDAGITLDGSFLGTIPLPQVSPLQLVTIPLGVDPAIQIGYPKPTVHRSTQGIFSKESAHIFNRAVYITNTKPTAIDLLVLDQAPVSQDERLRIDVMSPRGLNKEGDEVKSVGEGTGAMEGKPGWGKASALRKKAGEICWTVNLEKSVGCVLKFDYEARMPATESVYTVT